MSGFSNMLIGYSTNKNVKVGLTIVTIGFLYLNPIMMLAQQYPFQSYLPDDKINPLPGAAVWAIEQDDSGYMWLGIIGAGLVRYDGSHFLVYGEQTGYPQLGSIVSLKIGPSGRLWIYNYTFLLVTHKPLSSYKKGESLTFTDKIPSTNGDSIAIYKGVTHANGRDAFELSAEDKSLWVATAQNGVIQYTYHAQIDAWQADTLQTQSVITAGDDRASDVRSMVFQKNGTLLVSTVSGHLIQYTEEQLFSKRESRELPTIQYWISPMSNDGLSWTNTLSLDELNRIWGTTPNGGVWMISGELDIFKDSNLQSYTNFVTTLDASVNELFHSGTKLVWMADDSGIILGNTANNQFQYISRFSDGGVLTFFEDYENNIWVGTYQGLFKFPADFNAYLLYKPDFGNDRSNSILAVTSYHFAENKFPTIMAGGTGGLLLAEFDNGQLHRSRKLDSGNGLANNQIFDVGVDSKQRIWTASLRGISVIHNTLQNNPIQPYTTHQTKNDSGYISTIKMRGTYLGVTVTTDKKGNEWVILSGYTGVTIWHQNKMLNFNNPAGIPNVAYDDAFLDVESGFLILGAENSKPAISTFRLTPALFDSLLSIAQINNAGLPEVKSVLFTEVEFDTNLPDLIASSFRQDKNLLWAATSEGALSVDLNASRNLDFKKIIINSLVTNNQGLNGRGVSAIDLDKSGNVWTGSNYGLNEIDNLTGTVIKSVKRENGLADEFTYDTHGIHFLDGWVFSGTGSGLVLYHSEYKVDKIAVKPKITLEDYNYQENLFGRNELFVRVSVPSFKNELKNSIQYKLEEYEDEWHTIQNMEIKYSNLPAFGISKSYDLMVKGVDSKETLSDITIRLPIHVSPPIYLRWWILAIFVVLLYAVITYRMRWHEEKSKEIERKEAEQRQFETIQRIGASIAHDMKNTLFSLSLLASNLNKRFDNKTFRADAIDTLNNSLDYLKKLAERLQKQPSDWKVDKTSIDICVTVKQAYDRVVSSSRSKVTFTYLIPNECSCPHDANAIERVIENLLLNAVDAINEQGNIHLELKDAETKIEISVKDDGIGMSEDFIDNSLFKPFISTKNSGIGLGLFTCREIVRAHGGYISVVSKKGRGSVFTVILSKSE